MAPQSVRVGLEVFLESFPKSLKGKRLGVLCHHASVVQDYQHIVDLLAARSDCTLGALFGPQHGLYGQTQDNMVEWEGELHPRLQIPVYSLYGKNRTPTMPMLQHIDALIIDLMDVGARPYTYVWTIKNCCIACAEAGIPIFILDRPNPIGLLALDGPMLSKEYFSFVGGAEIPLCHKMTLGEIALFVKQEYIPAVELHVVRMEGWKRDSLFSDTGLSWVFPSPNMPMLDTALVYPGQVLLEATNLSEGRGTTRPFEICGAPYLDQHLFLEKLNKSNLPGVVFREHGFIPTFQKWAGIMCAGIQMHVTNPAKYVPVVTTAALLVAAKEASAGAFAFKEPPYEYETVKMPFDILAGDDSFRTAINAGVDPQELREGWKKSYKAFAEGSSSWTLYGEIDS